MMDKFIVVGLLITSTVMAVPTPDNNMSGKVDCFGLEDGFFSCLVIKANSMLARAARSKNIDLIDGVTFVREAPLERSGKALKSETEIMNELPEDASERALKLGSMLYDSAVSFFKSYSLKVNIPEGQFARALSEGRTKLKHKYLPMIIAAGVKIFALAPILFGGLSLLVLKAIFIGKLALIIAGLLAFQKLFGTASVPGVQSIFGKNVAPAPASYYDAGPASSWSVPQAQPVPQQGYYKRSFEEASKTAQNLAYSAHVPTTESDH